LTLFIGEPPCGGFPWSTRQNWTLTLLCLSIAKEFLFEEWGRK
jgi:hypothetical protein